MQKPFPAYIGKEPFIFVCYAHKDAELVYYDMKILNDSGFKIWYDEGIPAGSPWRAEIASALKSADRMIFFVSEASLSSHHCLREVNFALDNNINIIPVNIDGSKLPDELNLAFSRVQALHRQSDARYREHLIAGLNGNLESNRKNSVRPQKASSANFAAFILLVIAILIVGLIQSDLLDSIGQPETLTTSLPSAYELYLEAVDKTIRWEKDDNLESAIALLRDAIELDPDFALAYSRLGNALRISYALSREPSDLNLAAESANQALSLNSTLSPVWTTLGNIQLTQGNIDLAAASLESALEIDANDAEANQVMAKILERQGRIIEADSSYEKAVSLAPGRVDLLDAYATFLFRQGRFDEAVVQWQSVIRLAPDHYTAHVNLGSALNEISRLPEAITVTQRAIEIRSSYMAYSNLGTSYTRLGQYALAIEAFTNALRIDESDWLAWGNLGFAYSWQGGTDTLAQEAFNQAIELAESAREENPRDSYVNSDLALYYAKTGDFTLMEQRLGIALELGSDVGEILASAAESYEIAGNRERAIELIQEALARNYPPDRILRSPEFDSFVEDPRVSELF